MLLSLTEVHHTTERETEVGLGKETQNSPKSLDERLKKTTLSKMWELCVHAYPLSGNPCKVIMH